MSCRTAIAVLVLAAACSRRAPEGDRGGAPPSHPAPGVTAFTSARPPPSPPGGPLRYLVIGGGATPESTEVSLEQDVDFIRRTLPGPGAVLFAGGAASQSVRELQVSRRGDTVLTGLGDLFSPRAGRTSRYRPPRFPAEPATLSSVERELDRALSVETSPLLLHVAAHGDQGAEPRENSIALWGGTPLSVAALAALHEKHERPLRLVATSCFSGGFAELAFAGADDEAGPSPVPRCGLFAGTWDRETSGCDPDPDRRSQDSYALHFVHALAGKRRDGTMIDGALLDANGDGSVGLLDAHTWARLEAVSLDVPTTTSERWLRHVEPGSGPIDPAVIPEERRVVEGLGKALALPSEGAVKAKLGELEATLRQKDDQLAAAHDDFVRREAELRVLLLAEWPVLDDPYHPDFEETLRRNRDAIAAALFSSGESRVLAEARARADALDAALVKIELEEARVQRLARAYETQAKATLLMRRGGPHAEYYRRLLACERAAP